MLLGNACRICAIANQKGGVGKTTTAINLGTALAAIGERVLLIDMDPQGNASTGIGLSAADYTGTIHEVLTGEKHTEDAIVESTVPRLHVIPSQIALSGLEIELSNHENRVFRLRDALRKTSCARNSSSVGYSFVLIDCPPSLNLLTVNALVAAHVAYVPLQCEFFALQGLSQIKGTIDHIKRNFNSSLRLGGIILTMHDSRNNLSRQVESDVRDYFGDTVFDSVIPRNVRISEAPSFGRPVLLYDVRCAGSQAYIRLASELLRRERTSFAA